MQLVFVHNLFLTLGSLKRFVCQEDVSTALDRCRQGIAVASSADAIHSSSWTRKRPSHMCINTQIYLKGKSYPGQSPSTLNNPQINHSLSLSIYFLSVLLLLFLFIRHQTSQNPNSHSNQNVRNAEMWRMDDGEFRHRKSRIRSPGPHR